MCSVLECLFLCIFEDKSEGTLSSAIDDDDGTYFHSALRKPDNDYVKIDFGGSMSVECVVVTGRARPVSLNVNRRAHIKV